MSVPAAVANAVADALDRDLVELPLTPPTGVGDARRRRARQRACRPEMKPPQLQLQRPRVRSTTRSSCSPSTGTTPSRWLGRPEPDAAPQHAFRAASAVLVDLNRIAEPRVASSLRHGYLRSSCAGDDAPERSFGALAARARTAPRSRRPAIELYRTFRYTQPRHRRRLARTCGCEGRAPARAGRTRRAASTVASTLAGRREIDRLRPQSCSQRHFTTSLAGRRAARRRASGRSPTGRMGDSLSRSSPSATATTRSGWSASVCV